MKLIQQLIQKLSQYQGLVLVALFALFFIINTKMGQITVWFRAHIADISVHLIIAVIAHVLADAFYIVVGIH